MPLDLILGTAGHIDHGKTSLVKALTGVDTDRLPEEKSRGITIDIGFAALDLGDVRLGIVDVPGHERFIRNMLAGATGIDLALLVVAADDSVMPQTREHFELLQLLGVKRGVIALTKADLVDDTTREVAKLEVRELVKGSFLDGAPIIATSAQTGQGIDELKKTLRDAAKQVAHSEMQAAFRLPIDRAFVLQGHGTVVTGSVVSGSVQVGAELDWHKLDGTTATVRVRSLSNHGEPVEELHRGQRGAINLAGVSLEEVHRGQELATPGFLTPSRVLSVRLSASPDSRGLKHRLPVRFHIGTAEVMATVSLLDCDRVEPGMNAFGQVFLDDAVVAVWGQPFILRDSSAEATLGGGIVLQPAATKLRRRQTESLDHLQALTHEDPLHRAAAAVWFTGFEGLPPGDLPRWAGVTVPDPSNIGAVLKPGDASRIIDRHRLEELNGHILNLLGKLHAEQPLLTSHDRQQVLARLDYIGNATLVQRAVDQLIQDKRLVGDARRIARADFKPKLSINQRKLRDRIVADHLAAGFTPPEPASFVNLAGGQAKMLDEVFEVAVAEGMLVKVSDAIHLHADVTKTLEQKVRERLANGAGATVAEIRDMLGTTRKYAVPICEFLDRAGITRREGDLRKLKN